MSDTITLRQPDDWHLHLRDGAMLNAVATYSAAYFRRAIIMPNLQPPVTEVEAAVAYRRRIEAALPAGSTFTPLMTCYLTDRTSPETLQRGFEERVFVAAKFYPARATTNAAQGVTGWRNIEPALERMQKIGMPLLIHGEVTDPAVDIFDREACFIERKLRPLTVRFPALKVVLEHITTEEAVEFILSQPPYVAATVTPQHLYFNRNALLADGIHPHHYCLPVLKREKHRRALRKAVTSGHRKFFIGTDSAPHARDTKECACGCAGVFNALTALPVYAAVFEEESALPNLEAFLSENGPAFYGLPRNDTHITLRRQSWQVPPTVPVKGAPAVVPFLTGETLMWQVAKT